MPLIELTTPSGALANTTEVLPMGAQVTAEADALRAWVLVHEQAEGTWGADGQIIRYADLVALAKGAANA
ncbi:hypothetical protein JOF56_008873 [Kibdelosporangium banguiense]|uniref:Uncharacterized protein n=1 Tax=Kibdelosporangium banguiense TaxID=1365924 RepID=A0ABS4TVR1_9PSEU|nr:hypothetical protein [Kibdelosporangium banguiense]MBP2328488.1 hypothetical protein [Kibdelosporangium banguiense]